MFATREAILKKLERFNQITTTSATFTVFSKPQHPEPELERKLSEITDLSDLSKLAELIDEFNSVFTPCRIEYSLESTTLSGESKTAGHSEAEAMGKLADELKMSEAFDAACIAADEANDQEPMYVFQEQLMKAFAEHWAIDHKEAMLAKINELGFNTALESKDLESMVAIMSETQKPMWLDFWNKINELSVNQMDHATMMGLVEQVTEASKNSIKEAMEDFLARNAVVARV